MNNPLNEPIDLSKYGAGLKRVDLAPPHVRHMNRRNAMTRWMTAGLAIPPDTDDLRDLIKREVWTRGKTIQGLALALGMNLSYVSRVLSCHGNPAGTKCQRITPAFLDAVIRVLAIPSAVARRMHTLGARDAGWKL